MLHQRSVQGSNDSRENSRQKFPSIHPSIPFEFLVELVVSKDETPPSLSVPTPRFRWNEETAVRLIGNTVRDIISSGKLPSLVRTTGTIFRHGDVRNASYCCVWWWETSSVFQGSTRFPSQRRCLRRRLITWQRWRGGIGWVTAKNLSRMLIPASIPPPSIREDQMLGRNEPFFSSSSSFSSSFLLIRHYSSY